MNKKFILILILILSFAISAVNAEEIDNSTTDQIVSTNDISSFDEEINVENNSVNIFDNEILSATNETIVNNGENEFNINASNLVKYYRSNDRFIVTITDKNNNPIANQIVAINLNGATYTRTTDNNGIAGMNINLSPGLYVAVVTVNKTNVSATITILSTIIGNDVTKIYKNNTQYYATFLDTKGKYLAKGTSVTFILNGIFYTREIDNKGTAMLEINEEPGEYILTITNPINGEMSSNFITVLPNIVENYDLVKYYNESKKFSVKVLNPDGTLASGKKVTFTIGKNSYKATSNSNGYAYLNNVLQPGNYIVNTSYNGYKTLNQITILATLSNNDMQVSSSNINEGETEIINVSLPEDANGKISTVINDNNYSGNVNNGQGYILIPNLKNGEYYIDVIYSGDSHYNSVESNTFFYVEKTFDLIAPDLIKYYKGPERFIVTLTNSISNAEVRININGIDYYKQTNSAGQASMAINLGPGVYDVVTEYDGITAYSTITIKPTITGSDITKIYKNDTQYYATFKDSQGNYLADGTEVTFNINGVMYHRKVSGNQGLARLNINLSPGQYTLTAINPITGEMSSNIVKVLPRIIENKNLIKYYKNASQYRVKVLGDTGKAVGANEDVKFNINGVLYHRLTDASGYVQLSINLSPGTYIITAEYKGFMVSNHIKVLATVTANDLTKKYGESEQFKAKAVDGQGKAVVNQYVSFNINGVFYQRLTDNNGVAKLNINLDPGEYTITSSYNGFSTGNRVIVNHNPEKEYLYIDLPPYDTTITRNVGAYKIDITQWRSPAIGEVDIVISDSSGNIVNKYDIESKIFDGTKWYGPYGGFEAATYHKWHIYPDSRITQVALKIKGLNWN